jgi:hypothetical protein
MQRIVAWDRLAPDLVLKRPPRLVFRTVPRLVFRTVTRQHASGAQGLLSQAASLSARQPLRLADSGSDCDPGSGSLPRRQGRCGSCEPYA